MTPVEPAAETTAEALLRRWIGLDPGTVGSAAIRRAVRKRMTVLAESDAERYAARATVDLLERDLLVEEVVVAESWFFRDPQVYGFVRRFICDRVANRDRQPVRVLSVPCAAGEEPYSLAMTLLDAGLEPGTFVIDASDVSRAALERARAGRYTANAFRTNDLAFRDRWFRTEQGSSLIDPTVHDAVHFSWGNLLDESFTATALAAGRAPYDVIFCRNLLIYLTPTARTEAERAIDALLRHDGLLVLGAAEPPIMKGAWVPAGEGSVFALRRGVDGFSSITRTPRRAARAEPLPSARPAPTLRPSEPSAGDAATRTTPPPVESTVAWPSAGPNSGTGTASAAALQLAIRRANELANEGRLSEALEVCGEYQRSAGPTPDMYFLMGMIHQSTADHDAAQDCFHKTLYLDAAHADACLALALLAAQRGDTRLAELYRRAAARVVARRGDRK